MAATEPLLSLAGLHRPPSGPLVITNSHPNRDGALVLAETYTTKHTWWLGSAGGHNQPVQEQTLLPPDLLYPVCLLTSQLGPCRERERERQREETRSGWSHYGDATFTIT